MENDTEDQFSGFAERLRSLIGDDSVSKFAQDVGLGDNLIRKYLEGSNPGADKLVQIADTKSVNLVWLATGKGPRTKAESDAALDGVRRATERVSHALMRYVSKDNPEVLPTGLGSKLMDMAYIEHAANDVLLEYLVEHAPSLPIDSEFVTVAHYDVKASAGLGVENGAETIKKRNAFRREWWQRHIGLPPEQCFSMDIVGDSMSPRLTEAHIPIIQRVDGNELQGDGVYVFRLDGEVFIKYLERRPVSGLIARSENEKYTPWEIGDGSTFGEFKIIGRVIRKMIVELP